MNSFVSPTAASLTLTGVSIQRQRSMVTVVLRGNGIFRYQVILVDAYQLALDFPEAFSSLSFSKLSARHRYLKEIHITQYSKKLRLVFELIPHVRYAIKVGASVLAIQFRL